MTTRKKIIVIGAGPAGLSFALSLADTGIEVTLIDKQAISTLANPEIDGRDIALTHLSRSILNELDVWKYLANNEVALIKEAKVLDGASPYALHFDCHQYPKSLVNLGFLVPNYLIRQCLYQGVRKHNNIHLMPQQTVSNIQLDDQAASVFLDSGKALSADLVVAADSRFSVSRRQVGISASMEDFGRTTIVCRIQHERSHQQTAYECFHYEHTLAILPFTHRQSSIVITAPTAQAEQLLNLDDDAFTRFLQDKLVHLLGNITLQGERFSYPLVAVYANQFYRKRFALLGDAAVGMHPVTAHGFNLGLQGQQTLSRLIKTALQKDMDIGSQWLLNRYQYQHRKISKPIYLGTNAIVKLYTHNSPPAKLARKLLLHFSNRFPPIKQSIIQQLTSI